MRGATSLAGAHSYSVDCISWHPSHPELLCSASKRDTKFAYWDTRRQFHCSMHPIVVDALLALSEPKPIQTLSLNRRPISIQFSPEGQNVMLVDDDDKLSFLKFGEPLTSDGKKTWATSSVSVVCTHHDAHADYLAASRALLSRLHGLQHGLTLALLHLSATRLAAFASSKLLRWMSSTG